MKKLFKWVFIAVSIPVIFFVILAVLLYVPTIQNYVVDKVAERVSGQTGMNISIGKVRLGFPLNLSVSEVDVFSEKQDTLLSAGNLRINVQLIPLLRQQIEIDGIALTDIKVNTMDLIPSMSLKGHLGKFYLSSHGVALKPETAIINKLELSDTDLQIMLRDSVAEDTSSSAPLYWRFMLDKAEMEKVKLTLCPTDTTRMDFYIDKLTGKDGEVDLRHSVYRLNSLLLKNSSIGLDSDTLNAQKGFDPAHIIITDFSANLDSLVYSEQNMNAVIRSVSAKERSGLYITSLNGRLYSDETGIYVPDISLETPDSHIQTNASIEWNALKNSEKGGLTVRLLAEIGKQDLMSVLGTMPASFVREYPNSPLVLRAGVDGNMKLLRITGIQSDLKGAFSMRMKGEMENVLDSIKRRGTVELDMKSDKLRFLEMLADSTGNASFTIPGGIAVSGKATMLGNDYKAGINLLEGEGKLHLSANCNLFNNRYQVLLSADSMNIAHFLPKDSLRYVSADLNIDGQGFDWYDKRTFAEASLILNKLQYAGYDLSGIDFLAKLQKGNLNVSLESKNELLDMNTVLKASLTRKNVNANMLINIAKANLYEMRVVGVPLNVEGAFSLNLLSDYKKNHMFEGALKDVYIKTEKLVYNPKDIHFDADLKSDTTSLAVSAGDLDIQVNGKGGLEDIQNSVSLLEREFIKQVKEKSVDQNLLKKYFPQLNLHVKAGKDNPLFNFLSMNKMEYNNLLVDLSTDSRNGIRASSYIHSLSVDSLQLDTIRCEIYQDVASIKAFAQVKNAPSNKQFVFDTQLNASITPDDTQLNLSFFDGAGKQGIDLGIGVNAVDSGFNFKLYPQHPIIAFQKFDLNADNYIFLRRDGHIEADVKLESKDGASLYFYSSPNEGALQDLTASIYKVNLGEILKVIPYSPNIKGIFSTDLHYIQSGDERSIAVEASVDNLRYENSAIGNLACSAIYLPKEDNTHFVDARISLDGDEVASLTGDYKSAENDNLDALLSLNHLPLKMVNGFIPEHLMALEGDLDGEVTLKGPSSSPLINGQVKLDSVYLSSEMYGARFRMDDHPLVIADSKILFDDFSVYTQKDNPFRLAGDINFADFSNILFNLRMTARNYELINAPKRKNSILFGKVFVDVFSTLQGNLDNLKMRGNINVLGNTDVNYILKDSPLTVEDRLSGLVTFVDFNDTVTVNDKIIAPIYNTGGVDVLMTLRIDEGAQARVNLDENGDNYISLNGGGNLSMQYTPQGDFMLSGRYTVVRGEMKYELPVIPLKTFSIKNGSYVEFTGNPMNPVMNITATERVRTTVTENDAPRTVSFDVGIAITNSLENMGLEFTLDAPEDTGLQNQLAIMSKEERGKLAVAMLATGLYLGEGNKTGKSSGGFNANNALNSFLQSEITNIAGSALKSVDITLGMEDATSADGTQRTDYSFRFAKRFWNNRISIVMGGRISPGNNDDPTHADNSESFIDDISLEWRLDDSGTRYIRIFHNTNFDSMIDGEITETGAGIVLRKKMSKLSELFIFRRKKRNDSRDDKIAD